MHRTYGKKGFTLVEILIVVVILGILAAIVIPQFTSASESAKGSSLVSQLQTLRSQLELYQVQHNGDYPTQADFWNQLNQYTDIDGNTNATKTTVFKFGPYLQQPSRNPFEDSTSVATAAAANVGWVYDETAGTIYAVMDDTKATAVYSDKAATIAAGTDPDIRTY